MASVSAKDDGAGIRTAAPVAPSTKAPAHGRRAVQAHRRVVRSSTTESDEVMTPRTEAKAAASDALTRKLSNKNFYSVAPSGANKIDMSQFDDSDDSDPSDAATSSAMLPRRPSQPRNGNVVRAGRRRGQRSPAGKLSRAGSKKHLKTSPLTRKSGRDSNSSSPSPANRSRRMKRKGSKRGLTTSPVRTPVNGVKAGRRANNGDGKPSTGSKLDRLLKAPPADVKSMLAHVQGNDSARQSSPLKFGKQPSPAASDASSSDQDNPAVIKPKGSMSSMKQPHRPAERNAPTAKGQGEPQVVSAAPVGLSTPGSAAEALKSARDSVAANDSKARLNKYRSSQSTALAPVPGSQQANGQPTVRLNSYRSSQSSALRSVPGAGGHKLSALERYKARRAAGGLSNAAPKPTSNLLQRPFPSGHVAQSAGFPTGSANSLQSSNTRVNTGPAPFSGAPNPPATFGHGGPSYFGAQQPAYGAALRQRWQHVSGSGGQLAPGDPPAMVQPQQPPQVQPGSGRFGYGGVFGMMGGAMGGAMGGLYGGGFSQRMGVPMAALNGSGNGGFHSANGMQQPAGLGMPFAASSGVLPDVLAPGADPSSVHGSNNSARMNNGNNNRVPPQGMANVVRDAARQNGMNQQWQRAQREQALERARANAKAKAEETRRRLAQRAAHGGAPVAAGAGGRGRDRQRRQRRRRSSSGSSYDSYDDRRRRSMSGSSASSYDSEEERRRRRRRRRRRMQRHASRSSKAELQRHTSRASMQRHESRHSMSRAPSHKSLQRHESRSLRRHESRMRRHESKGGLRRHESRGGLRRHDSRMRRHESRSLRRHESRMRRHESKGGLRRHDSRMRRHESRSTMRRHESRSLGRHQSRGGAPRKQPSFWGVMKNLASAKSKAPRPPTPPSNYKRAKDV